MHIPLYEFFRDQGSIIAGILALLAGLVAYRAGKLQARATTQQNIELRTENRRRLAREGIIATRLLEGVLSKIKGDIDRLNKLLDQPQFFANPNATVPSDWRKLIRKPALTTVWDKLGLCERETINNYLILDAKIDEFIERDISGVHPIKNSLADFTNFVTVLRDDLAGEARRYDAVLSETSEQ
jgi:hypothetical protein